MLHQEFAPFTIHSMIVHSMAISSLLKSQRRDVLPIAGQQVFVQLQYVYIHITINMGYEISLDYLHVVV